MAWGATEDDVERVSQIMAHTVQQLETRATVPEGGPEDHSLPCEDMGTDDDATPEDEILGLNRMSIESQEAMKRSLSNAHNEWRRLAQRCKHEGEGK